MGNFKLWHLQMFSSHWCMWVPLQWNDVHCIVPHTHTYIYAWHSTFMAHQYTLTELVYTKPTKPYQFSYTKEFWHFRDETNTYNSTTYTHTTTETGKKESKFCGNVGWNRVWGVTYRLKWEWNFETATESEKTRTIKEAKEKRSAEEREEQ